MPERLFRYSHARQKKEVVRSTYSVQKVHLDCVVTSLRGSMRLLTFCCTCFLANIWPSRSNGAGHYVVAVKLQTHILPQSEVKGLLDLMSICEHALSIVFACVNLHFLKAVVLATLRSQRGKHECMLGKLCTSSFFVVL